MLTCCRGRRWIVGISGSRSSGRSITNAPSTRMRRATWRAAPATRSSSITNRRVWCLLSVTYRIFLSLLILFGLSLSFLCHIEWEKYMWWQLWFISIPIENCFLAFISSSFASLGFVKLACRNANFYKIDIAFDCPHLSADNHFLSILEKEIKNKNWTNLLKHFLLFLQGGQKVKVKS